MYLNSCIIFILTSNLLILCNLPETCGEGKQGLWQVLTPAEAITFILANRLPNRVSYNRNKQAYVVKEGSSDENGGHYVPRWQYLLSQVIPGEMNMPISYSDLLGQGQAAVPVLLSLLEVLKASDGAGGAAKEGGNEAANAGAAASEGAAENKKADAIESANEDAEAQAAADYKQLAIDILTSDLAILGYKTALSFVPGGPAVLKVWDTGSKLADVAGVGEKFPRL